MRLAASLSALAVAFRQLELASSHLHTELGEARKTASAAESMAETAVREAAEAGEEAGFLRHCLERLQEERGVSNPLTLTSLPLLRGEALHAAMERLSECEREARAAREATAGASLREKDALAWVGCGLASLRGEVNRLVKASVAEGQVAGSMVTDAGRERDEACARAEAGEREAAAAREAASQSQRELEGERERCRAVEGLLEACNASSALTKQRLEWAEEAVGVLKLEVSKRDAIIAAQGEALGKAYREIEARERGQIGALETPAPRGGGARHRGRAASPRGQAGALPLGAAQVRRHPGHHPR